ncbi:hypothetical protein AJ80_09659 [Polytolypa hystricis UAMH7299]|uniref:Peptidase S8/S53 domain-containing protein n=1 Tax=Polytolypa hystricis (strain UAMH7299) TaxID=1447883 RepID=A0A2B7WM48_POLH7|nr:hypothetical protein AJ80_09659 [Polytolypa hystricis UAMH7299]
MSTISINGNHLDPISETPTLRAFNLESNDASSSNYILVQTRAPLTDEQEDQLENLGVVIQEAVSPNTSLCSYKSNDLSAIRDLPFVAWANVYLNLFVVQSSLKTPAPTTHSLSAFSAAPKSRRAHLVDVLLHRDVDIASAGEVKAAIAAAAHADVHSLTAGAGKVRLNVEEQYLDDLAAVDEVRLIKEVHPAVLFNNKAVDVLNARVEVNGTEYLGEGQVVAVGDTGFDKGSPDDTHHAFTGRVKKLYGLGRDGKADDPDGHGTHVCGSVLGDGQSETMGGHIQGVAPKASLVVQSLLDGQNGLGGIPTDLGDLFLTPYNDDNARIHTNSWGSSSRSGIQLPYDASSEDIDQFVWEHKDMVILFAGGNSGVDANRDGMIDPRQIGSQAAAKNCITVGASENNRPEVDIPYGSRWPVAPIGKDKMADHPEGMAAFSSRGPTKEGRVKPDIVAPGTAILSTRSRNLVNAGSSFGTSTDPEWWFLAGTSMATPLVAGCVAVVRESLIANDTPNPSAALVKALLINGAVELTGQYVPSEAGPSPNSSSGFGLVNLANSLIFPEHHTDGGFHEGGPLCQGEGRDNSITVTIPDGGNNASTLKVTLVWTDYPGEFLQNDLDLIVIASNGTERHGNMGEKQDFDRTNNVEQVVWRDIPAGEAKIVVYAYNIFQKKFPQPYAVVWSVNRPLKMAQNGNPMQKN